MPDPSPTRAEGERPSSRTPGVGETMRFVFTYGWLWLCLLAVIATYSAVMYSRGAPWRGDIIWTIDFLPIGLILAGPLISGFVAVDTTRLAVGMRELPLPRGRTWDMAVAMTYAATLAVAQLVFSIATLLISRPGTFDRGASLAIAVQVAITIVFVGLGSLIGRFAPPVLGGLGASLAAMIVVYLFTLPTPPGNLLYAGAATTPRIGYDYSLRWLSVQLVALLGVALASWIVRPGPRRSRVHLAATSVIATALTVGAFTAVASTPGERLQPNDDPPSSCGTLAGTPWCYYPQHERVIDLYSDSMVALFEAANAQGYDGLVPAYVAEANQTQWPSDATTAVFYVTPEVLGGERPSLWGITTRLIEPVHCPQLGGEQPPGETYWNDLDALVATWVGLVEPEAPELSGYPTQQLDPTSAEHLIGQFRSCTYPFE